MAKQMKNQEHIEGRVYQHELVIKKVQNSQSANFGKEFISGTLDIATDDQCLNVVQVHFTYVTETTKAGKKNATFTALKKIIDEGKTVIAEGADAATKVKIDTAFALNDFYTQDGTLVSQKTNEGGFVTIVNELCPENERNTFTMDILITNVNYVEANEEQNIPEPYMIIRGAVFNFKNALLPIEFVVRNEAGMKYFEDLGITPSDPVFTKVWGRINSTTITIETTEESAFGEAAVKTYERKTKEWVITGTPKVPPYNFGDEGALTSEEVTKMMQDREVYLADVKKKAEEYRAHKPASSEPTSGFPTGAPVVNNGGFNF